MKTMSFLRSVIADARPRRPRLASGNRPAAPGRAEPPIASARGDIFPSRPAADRLSGNDPATHRLTPMAGPGRLEGSRAASADYAPAARHPAESDAVHDSPAASGPENGIDCEPAPDTTGGPAAGGALSVNGPDEAGGPRQGPKTVLSSIEITRSDAGVRPEMNSSLETSRPADGHDKLEHGPAVSLGPVENSEQADWDLSEQESQPGGEAAGSRPSGMVLAQLETEGQFAAVTEKAGPENADGGKCRWRQINGSAGPRRGP
jgi:hypothetical protein